VIYQHRLGYRLLDVHHRADLPRDLRLDVVALVEHERDARRRVKPARQVHLMQDPEQLERVGRPRHQVVVRVEPRAEVERPQLPGPQQHGNDELDVRARCVMPGVHAHQRPLAQPRAVQVSRAPVRHIRVVERRLEQLVLQDQPLPRPQPGRSKSS